MLDIALLGTAGMLPLPNRYLSVLLARYQGRLLLIDCGVKVSYITDTRPIAYHPAVY